MNFTLPAQGKSILVPVDLEKAEHSCDALQFVGGMAGELSVHVTVLYVANLNVVAVARRVHDELRANWEKRLETLARQFLEDCATRRIRVRAGKPHEQIIAEAEQESSELIVLSRPRPSRWDWFRPRTAERVVRAAPCLTLTLPRVWNITPERYRQMMRPGNAVLPFEDPALISRA